KLEQEETPTFLYFLAIRPVTTNSDEFVETICGKTFSRWEELSSHQRMEHSQSSQPPAGVS
ncbi:MAG TPA: C2H2-type zinc finger protein, partial [Nitrososphaeraceae archaeon]